MTKLSSGGVRWSEPLGFRALKGLIWGMGQIGLGEFLFYRLFRLRKRLLPKLKAPCFDGYEPGSHDVFVCTYAKSGTNWMLQICQQIAWRGDSNYEHIHHEVPWPDSALPTLDIDLHTPPSSPTGLRVVKTHLEEEWVPVSPESKYIVVIRDPKDAVVSGWHFAHSVVGTVTQVRFPIADWLDAWESGEVIYDHWHEHTAGWWGQRHEEGVLIVHFEDMKADLGAVVDQVAAHMGVSLSAEERERVLERSSFAWMKERNLAFTPPINPVGSGKPAEMIRRGEVGGSGEVLDGPQLERVMAHCRRGLEELDSDYPLDERYGL